MISYIPGSSIEFPTLLYIGMIKNEGAIIFLKSLKAPSIIASTA